MTRLNNPRNYLQIISTGVFFLVLNQFNRAGLLVTNQKSQALFDHNFCLCFWEKLEKGQTKPLETTRLLRNKGHIFEGWVVQQAELLVSSSPNTCRGLNHSAAVLP